MARRKKFTKIHHLLKKRRKCPECGSIKFARQTVGIWFCKKCEFKIAGLAYDVAV
ncbi:MAG: 50S ribosomal protein L37 [Nitrosopumilaceae archaeon]